MEEPIAGALGHPADGHGCERLQSLGHGLAHLLRRKNRVVRQSRVMPRENIEIEAVQVHGMRDEGCIDHAPDERIPDLMHRALVVRPGPAVQRRDDVGAPPAARRADCTHHHVDHEHTIGACGAFVHDERAGRRHVVAESGILRRGDAKSSQGAVHVVAGCVRRHGELADLAGLQPDRIRARVRAIQAIHQHGFAELTAQAGAYQCSLRHADKWCGQLRALPGFCKGNHFHTRIVIAVGVPHGRRELQLEVEHTILQGASSFTVVVGDETGCLANCLRNRRTAQQSREQHVTHKKRGLHRGRTTRTRQI